MNRYKLTLEYDGRGFVGWQRQENGYAVQQAIEEAVYKFCGETVTVIGAGRTDSGVHAAGQVAHLDLIKAQEPETVQDALNHHLRPHAAAVLAVERVPEVFHARTSARERNYLYRIVNRRAPLALDAGRAWQVRTPLDVAAMQEAGQALVGKHDFTSFRAALCQAKSPVKTLDELTVRREGDEIRIAVRARSFLHNQVRIITGTLRLVGEGKWDRADVAAALAAHDRAAAGPTAPAEGLYLTAVRYEDSDA